MGRCYGGVHILYISAQSDGCELAKCFTMMRQHSSGDNIASRLSSSASLSEVSSVDLDDEDELDEEGHGEHLPHVPRERR